MTGRAGRVTLAGMDDLEELVAQDRSLRFFDRDGRMHVEASNISKACVSPYLGREIPGYTNLGLDPNAIYKLYRDPDELRKAAPTFRNLPLLVRHEYVSAKKPRQDLADGCTGSDVTFEHPYLRCSLAVWTERGVKLVTSKAQEQLSSSYGYRADMTPGVSPDGVAFDGVMRDIVGNHVALVERGRAGPDVVVHDGALPVMNPLLRAILAVLGIKPSTEQTVALDALMALDADRDPDADDELSPAEKKAACDAMCKELGKDSLSESEEKAAWAKAKDKKRARDRAPPEIQPGGRGASDALPRGITQADVDATVAAAVAKATTDATAAALSKFTALQTAKDAVRPVIGVVALDSADELYKRALEHLKVDISKVPPAAYAALFDAVQTARAAAAATHRTHAQDSALLQDAPPRTAAVKAFPGLNRVTRGV